MALCFISQTNPHFKGASEAPFRPRGCKISPAARKEVPQVPASFRQLFTPCSNGRAVLKASSKFKKPFPLLCQLHAARTDADGGPPKQRAASRSRSFLPSFPFQLLQWGERGARASSFVRSSPAAAAAAPKQEGTSLKFISQPPPSPPSPPPPPGAIAAAADSANKKKARVGSPPSSSSSSSSSHSSPHLSSSPPRLSCPKRGREAG